MPRSALLVAALLALPVPAAAAQDAPPAVPPGLSREQPISVGGETIALAEIRHWARVASAGGGSRRGRPSRAYFQQAATLLISHGWIAGEARALGVRVTPGQVGRALRRQVHATFRSWRGFHRFLRRNRMTFADIRLRIRVDLLSLRLRALAIGDATGSEEQQARLDAYVQDFAARWRAQTVCTPRFATPSSECSNAPAE